MNQDIANYIEKQLESTKAERERKAQELAEEAARIAATQRTQALNTTCRALSLLGIEAGESDLSYVESEYGMECYFQYGNIQLAINTLRGFPYLKEQDVLDVDVSRGYKPYHLVDFQLVIRLIVPEEIREEYLELNAAGAGAHFLFRRNGYDYDGIFAKEIKTIEVRVEELGKNLERLPEAEIKAVFDSMLSLQAEYQVTYQSYLAWAKENREKLANKTTQPEPLALESVRYTYVGDSREAILAHVLRDIQADYYPEVEF